MRKILVPGGILVAFVGSTLVASCGIDTSGALDTSTEDAATPVDATHDTTSPRDGAGQGDTGNTPDGVSPPPDAQDGASPVDAMPPPPDVITPVDTGVDAGCTAAVGCFVLPGGWSVVAFDGTAGAMCPSGFSKNSRDVLEAPVTAGAGACTCDACNVSMQPNCQQGQVTVKYDTDGTASCGAGPVLLSADGKCDNFVPNAQVPANTDGQFTPPAPLGGACAPGAPTKHADQFSSGHDHLCDPDSPSSAGCVGNQCTPDPGGGFKGCILHPNDVSCPAGLGLDAKHLVGNSVTFDCGNTCSCTFSGSCDGTITYFTDPNCKNNPLTQTVDAVCRAAGGTGTFSSYQFKAQPTASCAAGGASTAQNVALTGVTTVCCPP